MTGKLGGVNLKSDVTTSFIRHFVEYFKLSKFDHLRNAMYIDIYMLKKDGQFFQRN